MVEPPGDFTGESIVSFASIGLLVTLAAIATIVAAALAAARTALYFGGLASREERIWSTASVRDRERAAHWTHDTRLLTVAIQICHTITKTIAVVSLVTALSTYVNIFVVIACNVLSLVLIEAIARLFARKFPVQTLSSLNWIITPVYKTMLPVAVKLDALNSRWRQAFDRRPTAEETLAQVMELAAAASETGEEKEVVKGIANFGVLFVDNVMKRRHEMCCLSASSNFEEVMTAVNQFGYSRIPVYRDSIDHIIGVLYIKDLLPFFGQGKDFPWVNIVRPGYFVPAHKKIDALLTDFQEKRVHIAIVCDDGGNTAGLISLEDLIEIVITEINEQRDDIDDVGYMRIDDRTYIFNGKTAIRDVFRVLDVEYPFLRSESEFESLEDFIVEINDELPAEGDELSYDQFTFVVEGVEQKRIKRVKVHIHEQA